MYDWKVTYHYVSRSHETMIVSGWKGILQLVRGAQRDTSAGITHVDVGPRIGPASVVFVLIDTFEQVEQ